MGFHAMEKQTRCWHGKNSRTTEVAAAARGAEGEQSCSTSLPVAVPTASVHGCSGRGLHVAQVSCETSVTADTGRKVCGARGGARLSSPMKSRLLLSMPPSPSKSAASPAEGDR
eukprot:scaffold27823_cov129-Isochrysis_galbana.AAC.6